MKDDLSQKNTWKYDYKYDITLLPKKLKTIFSRENTLKGD